MGSRGSAGGDKTCLGQALAMSACLSLLCQGHTVFLGPSKLCPHSSHLGVQNALSLQGPCVPGIFKIASPQRYFFFFKIFSGECPQAAVIGPWGLPW